MTYTPYNFPIVFPIQTHMPSFLVAELPNKFVTDTCAHTVGLFCTLMYNRGHRSDGINQLKSSDYARHPLYPTLRDELDTFHWFCKYALHLSSSYGNITGNNTLCDIVLVTMDEYSLDVRLSTIPPINNSYLIPKLSKSKQGYTRQQRNWLTKNYKDCMVFIQGVPKWVTESKQRELLEAG